MESKLLGRLFILGICQTDKLSVRPPRKEILQDIKVVLTLFRRWAWRQCPYRSSPCLSWRPASRHNADSHDNMC